MAPTPGVKQSMRRACGCKLYGAAVYQRAMEFEWDPAKADSNLAKHGIDFGGARRVFDDRYVLILPDPRDYAGETRDHAIGRVGDRILCVTFTMRGGNCRIISARRANRRERTAYSLQTRD